jgi:hypothetical protein
VGTNGQTSADDVRTGHSPVWPRVRASARLRSLGAQYAELMEGTFGWGAWRTALAPSAAGHARSARPDLGSGISIPRSFGEGMLSHTPVVRSLSLFLSLSSLSLSLSDGWATAETDGCSTEV